MTESELVERCRNGDRGAQHEVYARTSQPIYRLLLRMTGNPDDALDLAQETYLRAFAQMHRFDGRSALGTWLYRIAVNQALQRRRSEATRAGPRAMPVQGRAWSAFDGHAPCQGLATDASDARLDVADALAALSPDDRAILLLRYQTGLDYRTIAEVTGCPAGTVASRLNRARGRVRSLLGKSYAPREETTSAQHQKDGTSGSSELPSPRSDAG